MAKPLILAACVMNTEVIITVITEEIEKIKNGLKNLKAKQNAKLKEDGLVPDNSILEFVILPPKEGDDEAYTDLKIILKAKSTIRIKKMILPDNSL
jgi:hypothetical protein